MAEHPEDTLEPGAVRHLSPDEEAEVREMLRSIGRQAAPERFGRALEGRIRRRSRGRFFDPRWQATGRTTYLAAGVVLVILAALYLFSQVTVEVRDERTGRTGNELRQDESPED